MDSCGEGCAGAAPGTWSGGAAGVPTLGSALDAPSAGCSEEASVSLLARDAFTFMLLYAGLRAHPASAPQIAQANKKETTFTCISPINCVISIYFSLSAATPGKVSPARNSSDAPPPVET